MPKIKILPPDSKDVIPLLTKRNWIDYGECLQMLDKYGAFMAVNISPKSVWAAKKTLSKKTNRKIDAAKWPYLVQGERAYLIGFIDSINNTTSKT